MTATTPSLNPLATSSLADLEADALASPTDVSTQMKLGTALHGAGQPERALGAFEAAHALDPTSADTASACATLLYELNRPQAAYKVLVSVREALMRTASGATNLAIAAETCGQIDEARAAYAHALTLDANNVRALNNLGLLHAREGDWDKAIDHARRALLLLPAEPALWMNLSDVLARARRFDESLAQLELALKQFPQVAELAIRRGVLLAYLGEFSSSQAAFEALGPQALELWKNFLASTASPVDKTVRKESTSLPDAHELFTQQAFEALQDCDWRDFDKLTATLRTMLAGVGKSDAPRDWRATQFYTLVLPLTEEEHADIRIKTIATLAAAQVAIHAASQAKGIGMRPFARSSFAPGQGPSSRIRIGMTAQSLRDGRFTGALQAQLALHDRNRFSFHVYSPTPLPEAQFSEGLAQLADSVVETAHMSTDEATQRIRLDNLDILIDLAFYTPWCRAEIYFNRAAPVQIRQQSWQRKHLTQAPYEYTLGDTFTHPGEKLAEKYGPVVRFAHTCWLAAEAQAEALQNAPVSRAGAGLPEDAVVLCSFVPAMAIDPQTFALWMRLLRDLPDAVLWLPGYNATTRANLQREAASAGVGQSRLIFAGRMKRQELAAHLALADIFLDPLRFNANHGLVDSLRAGVPAISLAGDSMASRLGGSIIRAAGLPECVFDNEAGYADAAIALAGNESRQDTLRAQLLAGRRTAPLFDTQARVREWEAAWTVMAERARAGLPPAAFDVSVA